ncbi:MAG: hypothetical protein D6732_18950 [Methanobacteriota archaeon]|nr:MAG: hypothetical protein D6732_18950 [Euryarchaeota archaeon]
MAEDKGNNHPIEDEKLEKGDEQEFVDVIHTTPKTIEFISDPEKVDLMLRNDLYPILALLRHGNFTVKEITELYSTYAGPRGKSKSEKTIYRYLRDLKNGGLIDEVGQRVIKGQTATEKIWGRTAKVFYILRTEEDDFKENLCDENCIACRDDGIHQDAQKGIALMSLLKNVFPVENPKENYSKFMNSLERAIMKTFQEQLDALTEDELNQVAKLPYSAINNILTISGLIELSKKEPDFIERRIKKYLK